MDIVWHHTEYVTLNHSGIQKLEIIEIFEKCRQNIVLSTQKLTGRLES